MPNWCAGDLKVRGKYKDIKEFISKELFLLEGNIFNREAKEPVIEEDGCGLNINSGSQGLWFKNLHRSYFNNEICIDVYTEDCIEIENTIVTANLGELQSAWGTDTVALIELSKQYDLDFKIYAYERGMQFNIDFEVHKGEVIKNFEIKFNDYVWECTNPSMGG